MMEQTETIQEAVPMATPQGGALTAPSHGELAAPRRPMPLLPETMADAVRFAELMASAGIAVRGHLRDNKGACLMIVLQAMRWRLDPFQVASKTYLVPSKKTGDESIAYESQLIHAVINMHAGLAERLSRTYTGEGLTRRCKVVGKFLNGDIRECTSPEIKDIKLKNSPLWFEDPDRQLFYYTTRAWAREWAPEVLMGVICQDEVPSLHSANSQPRALVIDGDPFADEPAQPKPAQPSRQGVIEDVAVEVADTAEAVEKELDAALAKEITFEGVKTVGERFADRIKSTGEEARFRTIYYKHTNRIRASLEKNT